MMKWTDTWLDGFVVTKYRTPPRESEWSWENVYQAFKERMGREIYMERTESPKFECTHGAIGEHYKYEDKFCRDCGGKL